MRNLARGRHLGVCNRTEQGTEEGRSLGDVPCRQRHASARHDHTSQLLRGPFGLADVQDDDVAYRGVERSFSKRKVGSRSLDERGIGIAPGGELDHGRGDVDPGRERAACDRSRGDVSRTRSDIENAHARSDACGVEQRLDRLSGDRAQELAVAIGDELPPGRLELVECLGVDVGHQRSAPAGIGAYNGRAPS